MAAAPVLACVLPLSNDFHCFAVRNIFAKCKKEFFVKAF